jgi:predicted GIY-YIG superfamily endonuclease
MTEEAVIYHDDDRNEDSHHYIVVNQDKKTIYFGQNAELAQRVYEQHQNAALFATKGDRPLMTCLRRNGKSRIVIHT